MRQLDLFTDYLPQIKTGPAPALRPPEPVNERAEQFAGYRHGLRRLNELMPDKKAQVINDFRRKFQNSLAIQKGWGGDKFADFVFDALFAAGVNVGCSSVCDFQQARGEHCGVCREEQRAWS